MRPLPRMSTWTLTALTAATLASCTPATTTSSEDVTAQTAADVDVTTTIAAVLASNTTEHTTPAAATDSTHITLTATTANVDGPGASIDAGTVTITAAGTYAVTGTLDDGQLVVDAPDGDVHLLLTSASITSSTGPAIHVKDAASTHVNLTGSSSLTDATTYADTSEDAPNAALYSRADLTIDGDGTLQVTGRHQDAIASADGIVLASGTLTATAVDDGVRANDYVTVAGAAVHVDAGGDGIKAKHEDTDRGFVHISSGTVQIDAGDDAITASSDILLADGTVDARATSTAPDSTTKGLTAGRWLIIEGGQLTVEASDDALASDTAVLLHGGDLTLSAVDDGVHADKVLAIDGGTLHVTSSYEGLEAARVVIAGGFSEVVSSDDGLNAASGQDTQTQAAEDKAAEGARSGQVPDGSRGDAQAPTEMPAGQPGPGGQAPTDQVNPRQAPSTGASSGEIGPGGGDPNQDMPRADGAGMGGGMGQAEEGVEVVISGGTLVLHAGGDGLDSNGTAHMSGGTVVVNGPEDNGNGALDVAGQFDITGGTLWASGSAGMATAPSADSAQASVAFTVTSPVQPGTVLQVLSGGGMPLATFTTSKVTSSVVWSSPEVVAGDLYELVSGGTTEGGTVGGLSSATSTGAVTLATATAGQDTTQPGRP